MSRKVTYVLLLVVVFATALFVFTTTLHAQKKPAQLPDSSLDTWVNIDFPGGDVQGLLHTIEKATKTRPNVILSEDAGQLPLPAFSLRSVTVREAFEAVQMIHRHENIAIEVRSTPNIVAVSVMKRMKSPTPSREMVRVFDVEELVSGGKFGIEDIVTAIEAAWSMQKERPDARVRFHQETKLLIIVGMPDELHIGENVLEMLYRKEHVPGMAEEEKVKLALQIEMLRSQIEKLAAENAQLGLEINKLREENIILAGRKEKRRMH